MSRQNNAAVHRYLLCPNRELSCRSTGQCARVVYANEDDQKRFAILRDNLVRAQKLQLKDQGTARYGVTQFSDLTPGEFAAKYLGSPVNNDLVERVRPNGLRAAPERMDWRAKGAETAVENQGSCGSCWAFSTAGNVEGQRFTKTSQLVSLSKQQLVDCDRVAQGCNGGWPASSYLEIMYIGRLESQDDYPYVGVEQKCALNKEKLVAKIDDFIVLGAKKDEHAAYLAEHGPLSTLLNAHYQSGVLKPIFEECPDTELNHAVLTVGYDKEGDMPYWSIKNSWGTEWGEKVSYSKGILCNDQTLTVAYALCNSFSVSIAESAVV
ncbi:hypothetical protein P879_02111 [Paragonimus westermani]|uniref:Cathepsin F n=1 Tax=Paragonimus westermani TaxID=34504 RepID=A0A8T0DFI5_9TREM|nr:hypothetical protein P879_02111 [Paragonimus westermani]